MSTVFLLIPRIAALVGGAAVGILAGLWRSLGPGTGKPGARRVAAPADRGVVLARAGEAFRVAVSPQDSAEIAVRHAGFEIKLAHLESRVEQHDRELRAAPSAQGIQAAIERAFDRSAAALDLRFSEQARSIESLKTMVGQTDELLEKVLDSIYSLSDAPAGRERDTAQVTH